MLWNVMTLAGSSALQGNALINALQPRHRVLCWIDEMDSSLQRWTQLMDSVASDSHPVYGLSRVSRSIPKSIDEVQVA
jgi:hypothetical protein